MPGKTGNINYSGRPLVQSGADINAEHNRGYTSLRYSTVKDGILDIVKYFIEHEADINVI